MWGFFRINHRLVSNSAIKFRNFSTTTTETATINKPIAQAKYSEFISAQRGFKNKIRKVDLKKFSFINFQDLEIQNKIPLHFSESIKNASDENSVYREIDYYLNYEAKDVATVSKLYQSLPGTYKKNNYVLRSFLRFFKNNSQDQLFLEMAKSARVNDSFDTESYVLIVDFLLKQEQRDYSFLDKMVKKLRESIEENSKDRERDYKVNNLTKSILIEYYLEICDFQNCENFFKSCSTEEEFPVDHFILFIQRLIKANPQKALDITKKTLIKYDRGIKSLEYIRILQVFKKENRNDCILEIWSSSDVNFNKSKFIIEYLTHKEGDIHLAKTILEELSKKDKFNLINNGEKLMGPLFNYYLAKKEPEEVLKLLKFIRKYDIILSPQFIFHSILKPKLYDFSVISQYMLSQRSFLQSFGWVIAYCERYDTPENKELVNNLLEPIKNNPRLLASAIFDIVQVYLLLDDFQKAVQWYTSASSIYQINTGATMFHIFMEYHKKKGEQELVEFWRNSLVQSGFYRDSLPGPLGEKFIKRLDQKIPHLDLIHQGNSDSDFVERFDSHCLKSEKFMKEIQKRQQRFLDSENRPNQIVDVVEVESLIRKNDVQTLKIQLANYVENQLLPKETIVRILDIIYLNNPDEFISYTSTAFKKPTLEFKQILQSTIIKFDFEKGVELFKDDILKYKSPIFLSSILIYAVRKGYIRLSLAILRFCVMNNLEFSPQARYIIALEFRNIQLKSQTIHFNYNTNTDFFFFNNDKDDTDFSGVFRKYKKLKENGNYYLYNNIEDPDLQNIHVNKIFAFSERIKSCRFHIFTLYKNFILDAPDKISSTLNVFYRYYDIPLSNLCIHFLIDLGEEKNADVIIDRALSLEMFNRETLLLYIQAKRKFNKQQFNIEEIINKYNLVKKLNLLENEIEKLIEISNSEGLTADSSDEHYNSYSVYLENYTFIREYLRKPKRGEDVELRNNYIAIDNMDDKDNEDFIWELSKDIRGSLEK
ncbi:hypothetical protein DICPUDRAFT_151217 [Dictyostelium purpureum]|uniref:Uncharacterized protein n=1 Tax=Dictyostelium purpureum TaxID=5786 RepID=F0ZIA4_DICPU|nr:uncharacterized protein DICPUDRAFT_151217 [Dictyostelium purpureum]EGC36340.1 hypothetical protein DICPUDRAFT_151217 [Dictyostelium purpureum]|eukprot:XP_003287155.1 hypothetical protein DICPUDRAFT_151217 [Dictyostelium purpureum]